MCPSLESPTVRVPLGSWGLDRLLLPGRGLRDLEEAARGLADTHPGSGVLAQPLNDSETPSTHVASLSLRSLLCEAG